MDTKNKTGAGPARAARARRVPGGPDPFRGTELLLARSPNAGRLRRKLLAVSLVIHVFLFAILLVMLPRFKQAQKPPRIDIVFYPRDAEPFPAPQPKREPVAVAKVEPPPEPVVV